MGGFSRSTATIKPALLPAGSQATPLFRKPAPVRRSTRSDPGATEFRTVPSKRARIVPCLLEHADASLQDRPMHVAVARQQTKAAGSEVPRDAGEPNKPVRQHACTTLKQFSTSPSSAQGQASASEIAFF